MVMEATPIRRTQVERSTATRARLLDATIECLVEFGYSGTTVVRVSEAAEVTRGAQVHHFPTKEVLVTSAVGHLNQRRSEDTIARLRALDGAEDWVEQFLDVMWESHRGPVFIATAEMWVAARTNPQLSAHLGGVEEIIDERVEEAAELKGHSGLSDPAVREAVYTAMDAIRGLVISSWHLPEAEVDARWKRLKRHLLLVFPS